MSEVDDIAAQAKARAKAKLRAQAEMQKMVPPEESGPTVGGSFVSGLAKGGLPEAIAAGTGTYLDKADVALKEGAYKAGGAVTDLASKVVSPETAAKAGYAANVGIQAVPAVLGGEITRPLAGPIKNVAANLMQSAIKPTLKQLKTGEAARAIDTMLKRGFNATEGGMARLKAQIEKLDTQIADAIKNSTETIKKADVGKALQDTYENFKSQVNPKTDLETIKKAWLEFRNHPDLAGKVDIPVQKAQELKQGTYRQLSKKYGEMSGAEIEAQKGLARGLKEQIAAKVPSIRTLNAEDSELINALNVTERRVLMGMNNNPAGLSLLAGNKAAAAAFMADKSALFKSILSRMLYNNADPLATSVGRIGVGGAEAATQN